MGDLLRICDFQRKPKKEMPQGPVMADHLALIGQIFDFSGLVQTHDTGIPSDVGYHPTDNDGVA